MRLGSLPDNVQNAILSSAIGLAAHLDANEFLVFWNKTLDADYPDPTKQTKPELVEINIQK